MSQPPIDRQTAHSFQRMFHRSGYETPKDDIAKNYNQLLAQVNLSPIDNSREVIVSHIRIDQANDGCLSFLLLLTFPTNTVSIAHIYGTDENEQARWRSSAGGVFITNERILLLCNSKSPNSYKVDYGVEWWLSELDEVWVRENRFFARFHNYSDILCLQMIFPQASLVQVASQFADETPEDRYYAARTAQDIKDLERKQQSASDVLYNYFSMVIQSNRTRQSPKKLSNDMLALIKKLEDLKNAGLINDEEFNQKKREILSRV